MKNQIDDYAHVPTDEDALLDKQQVAQNLSISVRTIDNLVKAGDFPPGVRLGRFLYWSIRTVATWRRNQFASQERWRPHA